MCKWILLTRNAFINTSPWLVWKIQEAKFEIKT